MEWWNALDIDTGVDTGDYEGMAYLIGGLLLATAILIFGWRIVKDMSFKTVAIIVGLVVFIIVFVIPNWR